MFVWVVLCRAKGNCVKMTEQILVAKPALLANVTVNASAPKSIEPVWLASSTEDTGPSFCSGQCGNPETNTCIMAINL